VRVTPDEALDNFRRISKHKWTGLTESDTRVKLIDRVFTECLNWEDNEDISREEHASTGFVDYVFKIGNRNIFVVEAKKQGVAFNLPIFLNFRRKYNVGGILSTDKTLREVMMQAQGYCNRKGARFGVISNGEQYVIFEAVVAYKDWDNGNCRIFYNLDDIERNFVEFWNLLSKDAVERGSLVECLSKKADELIFARPVDNIRFRNEIQPRNELYEYMNDIIKFAFKDIIDNDRIEMLRRCYVSEREFTEPTRSIKNHFTRDLESNFNIKRVVESSDSAGVFQAEFNYYSEVIKSKPPAPVVFLLLGKIGSGKTTFIFRFFNIVLTEEERSRVKWFYVNIKDAPKDEKYLRQYLLESIFRNFERTYKELLTHVKSQLKMENLTASVEDLSRLFLVLRYEGFTPSLVIDNVDQHTLEVPSFHEKVFLEANNLTKELRTITIMTLREESFYRSAIQGVFDAYYIEKYIITPPDLRSILLTRIDYVLEKMDLPNPELQTLLKTNLDYVRRRKDIKDFLSVVRDTIFKSYRRSVVKFLSGTSGGDVRRALELFERFLPSGNIKIGEILDIYRRTGSYTIAEHQFVKSIALGSHRFFSKQSSFLMNVFEIDEFLMSHFLKLKILNYAEDRASIDSPLERGFIAINELMKHAYEVSIPREAIEQSLLNLAEYGLILLNTRSRETLEGASHFRITECGNYYLRVLPNRFSYVDLVLADTPIANQDAVKKLRDMLPNKELGIRFDRTRLFINYLREMEEREIRFRPEYEDSPLAKYKFTKKMEQSLQDEQKYIRKSMENRDILGSYFED
jgi:KaiC/GvpD/RAD55 family RecA-like ATPase